MELHKHLIGTPHPSQLCVSYTLTLEHLTEHFLHYIETQIHESYVTLLCI